MDRTAAIRKVVGLRTLAEHPKTHVSEADTARALADKLMSRHGITEDDVEPTVQVDLSGLFSGFGGPGGDWRHEIDVEIKALLLSIETLVAKIERQQNHHTRAKGLAKLYSELRTRVEGPSKYDQYVGRAVKAHRDHAVYHAYKQAKAESEAQQRQYAEGKPDWMDEWVKERIEKDGLWAAETAGDLGNSRNAEAAVRRGGEAHRYAVEQRVKEQPCAVCGEREKEGGSYMWTWWSNGRCYAVHHQGECWQKRGEL